MRVLQELSQLSNELQYKLQSLKDEKEVASWAKPFILRFCQVCLPESALDFKPLQNPQDSEEEEEKESMQD